MASSIVSKACKVKRLHLCIKFIKTWQFVTWWTERGSTSEYSCKLLQALYLYTAFIKQKE